MDQALPTTIGKYEILSVIGRGGMGIVYRAQDPLMGRSVAIKTVTEDLNHDVGMLQRFYGEAEKMGMLRHPNIITVFDLGEHNGYPYIVMEFVEGDPLDRLIGGEKPFTLFDKLRVIEQVCAALAYAHQNDVVHRDVKPANVIVRPDGVAKLLDFGIARQEKPNIDRNLTTTGSVVGTVPYMAPERLRGAPFDGRSDIFSAGVLLFQVLTGRMPFLGVDYVLVNQLLNEKHPPLSEFLQDYPPALDGILDRSLAKEPSERYQSADEMGAELYSIIETMKEEYTHDLMNQASELSAKEDFLGAQNAVYRILKMDPKNVQARQMMKDLGQRVSNRARVAQAEQLQRDADNAIRDKNFDQAIQLLEDAGRLLPNDARIIEQMESAKARKQTSDQILGYLHKAEQAKRSGDYTVAGAILEKAILLDTNNSRLRAALDSLIRQAETAAQQAKLNSIVEQAKETLARRDYQAVLDIVQQAEAVHPDSLELQELAGAARDGIAQEQRRKLLQSIEDRISNSSSEKDAQAVALLIRESLDKSPSDATLLRYQAQIERILHDHQIKRQVDETVRQCVARMKTAPMEALEIVRNLLAEIPGEERLVALETRIQEHIGRLSTEEARAAVLLQANDALRQRDFAMAVAILQRCQAPVLTKEISELLEYAREQSRLDEQQKLVARTYAESQTLMRDEKYRECVALLGPVVQSTDDARLKSTLEQAQTLLAQRNAEQAQALALLTPFAEAGCHEQVIAIGDRGAAQILVRGLDAGAHPPGRARPRLRRPRLG
jgi:serine/threonine protein kinase